HHGWESADGRDLQPGTPLRAGRSRRGPSDGPGRYPGDRARGWRRVRQQGRPVFRGAGRSRSRPAAEATGEVDRGPDRELFRPQATYLIERMMDLLAVELGRDPARVRKHNFIGREAFPYRNPAGTTYDSGDYAGALDRLLAMADYPRLRRDQAAARQAGRLHGIGMAAYVDIGGGGPADRSAVHLEMDGS